MRKLFNLTTFLKNEDGAITVDWVVLSAAVIGLAVLAVGTITTGVETAGSNISTALSTKTVD